jgi:hypothetical protein
VLGAVALVVVGATALVASATFRGPASAETTSGGQTQPMMEVTQVDCDGTSPAGTPTQSSATIRLNGKNVAADVSLNGLVPNEKYVVTLTQTSPQSDCGGDHAIATTDAQGNASVRVSAPRIDGRRGAFIHAEGARHVLISRTFDFGD